MAFLKSTAAIVKGMFTTLKHTARPAETVSYPEVKRPVAPKYRGRHRLHKTKMEVDGQTKEVERCIACSLCAAACPSQAIYVEAADNNPANPNSPGERFAVHYEINMLRCIFCGYCEEACPVDAIKLGAEYELADTNRHALVYTKQMLLEPEKFAPKGQYHADVDNLHRDKKPVVYDVKLTPDADLDTVYKTHAPLGKTLSQLAETSSPRPHRAASVEHNAKGPTAGVPSSHRRG
ncbi:MAG TPA: NADH-quinone oxidoreductase subunit I [Myxococcota bacterium]